MSELHDWGNERTWRVNPYELDTPNQRQGGQSQSKQGDTLGVCELCGIYWPCDDDNTVPICPQDTSENRDHPVVVYRRDS